MNLKEFVAQLGKVRLFVELNYFDTGDAHGWYDFTEELIKTFGLKSSIIEDEENGVGIHLATTYEKAFIEQAYYLVDLEETTVDYIFGDNIEYGEDYGVCKPFPEDEIIL